jgi:hypothetical protein
MAEIDDGQLAEFKRAAAILKELSADNATGIELKKLMKKKWPTWSDPELDALEVVTKAEEKIGKRADDSVAELKTMLQSVIDERKKEKEDSTVEAFKKRLDKVRDDYGYTEEGVNKILEVMKDRGIQNPEDAAIIFEKNQPAPVAEHKPYTTRMAFVRPDGKDDQSYKDLMTDPEQWAVDEMYASLREGKQ